MKPVYSVEASVWDEWKECYVPEVLFKSDDYQEALLWYDKETGVNEDTPKVSLEMDNGECKETLFVKEM